MPRSYPLVVALTGGIGSGKSTVAQLFADLGVPVIDADHLSRELVTPGSDLLKKIIAYFGQAYLDKKGNLLRHQLRARIFAFPEDRQWLEQLLHPAIYARMKEKLNALYLQHTQKPISYIICVIPLLFETSKPDFIDRILVVDTEERTQIHRLILRDHLTKAEAENTLKSQCNRTVRLGGADDIITNTSDINSLKAQVWRWDQQYKFDTN